MDKSVKAVIVPCYKVAESVAAVLSAIPAGVDHVIVVDDACPQGSGDRAATVGDPRVMVLRHAANRGVGAAMVTGYRKALELGCDICIKMDGDGQMDPARLGALVAPLEEDRADYAKGNRFRDFRALRAMPGMRLAGNSLLSFVVKAASGYWNIMDPTNGYTAIHRRVLSQLNLERLARRYFFESDMLISLNILGAVVRDVEMPARYGEEGSSLRISRVAAEFPLRLAAGCCRRLFLKYFVHDFNMASVYLLLGVPMFAASVAWGVYEWMQSVLTGEPRTAGTIMLVALPIILSFQMLLQAIQIDINSVPRRER
jgi:glycosyltransferase involved in cell wall biosynthesis